MKKHYSLLAFLGMALASSAAVPQPTPISSAAVSVPTVETMAKVIKTRSLESPESEFTATKARFYYYDDFYKDGQTACYQLVITNSEDGFSSGGTLPAGEGQLICAFLCGPKSEDKENPVLPAGKYEFSKTSGEVYTFSARYSHYVDAFMYNGSLAGWQLPPAGGSIEITEEDGIYDVVANITAAELDEETDELISVDVTATYKGRITVPGPLPDLPGDVYEMNIPEMGGMYDSSQNVFALTFWGCGLDDDGFIVGRGDLLSVYLYYKGDTPFANLPGSYEFVEYTDSKSWSNDHFLGGYLYKLSSDFVIPFGTYCAVYNDGGAIESCGLAYGGKITVTSTDLSNDGNMKFEFDLVAKNGTKMIGSWEGNVFGKITGFETSGIREIDAKDGVISGQTGSIIAPADAKVFTTSGIPVGKENLGPGLYIVNHNGKAVKVVVK